jgi:hypothetical protein
MTSGTIWRVLISNQSKQSQDALRRAMLRGRLQAANAESGRALNAVHCEKVLSQRRVILPLQRQDSRPSNRIGTLQ